MFLLAFAFAAHAESTTSFYTSGAVERVGVYDFAPGLTVSQALIVAGGPSEVAGSHVRVIHVDGTRDDLRIRRLLDGRDADPVVQPGDRLYIAPAVW